MAVECSETIHILDLLQVAETTHEDAQHQALPSVSERVRQATSALEERLQAVTQTANQYDKWSILWAVTQAGVVCLALLSLLFCIHCRQSAKAAVAELRQDLFRQHTAWGWNVSHTLDAFDSR